MATAINLDQFPEWSAFEQAVQVRRPDAGTWCEAWTVRDIVIHQAGNAAELARVLSAHLAGNPVESTRSFKERELPYRSMNDADLFSALHERMGELSHVAEAGSAVSADTDVAWTGRTMKVPWFAEHMREELILHRWDITGDDNTAKLAMDAPWMTDHSVTAVGRPLLARGLAKLNLAADQRFEARLRVLGHDDVAILADGDHADIALVPADGRATLETDAGSRILLLWGRRPADPGRIRSTAGPETLARVRTLLNGY